MGKLPAQTYYRIAKDKIDSEAIRSRLKLKYNKESQKLLTKYPKIGRYIDPSVLGSGRLREQSVKFLSAGALLGALLFSPQRDLKSLPPSIDLEEGVTEKDKNSPTIFLAKVFKDILPADVRPLSYSEEKLVEQIIFNSLGIKTDANLEGEHLNTIYGLIGAEQHLMRYPGDRLSYHGAGDILAAGMAPGRGAWGYFAPSELELTNDLIEMERWYVAVQTLYLPDWSVRQPYLKNWYKYRKVLVVNTQNGKAVVAAIADSGPAAWTGKQFGGSPEVMQYLGGIKYKKGPVLVLFVDDPENKVQLGPVRYKDDWSYPVKLN